MVTLKFTIPGDPQGKERPRFGSGRVYTPRKTARYEALAGYEARGAMGAMGTLAPVGCPVRVAIRAFYSVPASYTKRQRAECAAMARMPGKPDADNIAKAVLDALNGIVFEDDRQVQRLAVSKLWCEGGDPPRVEVVVEWDSNDWEDEE